MNPNEAIEIIYSNNNNNNFKNKKIKKNKSQMAGRGEGRTNWREISSFLFSSLRFFFRFTEIGP